jgi:hypothetical protein
VAGEAQGAKNQFEITALGLTVCSASELRACVVLSMLSMRPRTLALAARSFHQHVICVDV